jgi:hypothetical protein
MQAAAPMVAGRKRLAAWTSALPPLSLPITAVKMAQGIFIGLTECELLDLKAKALALILDGKTLMSYADSGSSATKAFALPPKEMLNEAMFALSRLDPSVYGRRRTMINTRYDNRFD